MEDFVVACPLVPGLSRLVSGSCSSPRAFVPRFLQTPPHGDALALPLSFASTWLDRGLSPPSVETCPAHTHPVTVCRPNRDLSGSPQTASGRQYGAMRIETMRRARLAASRFHRAPSQTGRAPFKASGFPARRQYCLGFVARMTLRVPLDGSSDIELSVSLSFLLLPGFWSRRSLVVHPHGAP